MSGSKGLAEIAAALRGDRKDAAFKEAKAALEQFDAKHPVSHRRAPTLRNSSSDLSCHSGSSAGDLMLDR